RPKPPRLSPPLHAGDGRPRLPDAGAGRPKSPAAGLTLPQAVLLLHPVWKCWTGRCSTCQQPINLDALPLRRPTQTRVTPPTRALLIWRNVCQVSSVHAPLAAAVGGLVEVCSGGEASGAGGGLQEVVGRPLLALCGRPADPRRTGVVPGGLDQDPPGVLRAGLGDRPVHV